MGSGKFQNIVSSVPMSEIRKRKQPNAICVKKEKCPLFVLLGISNSSALLKGQL